MSEKNTLQFKIFIKKSDGTKWELPFASLSWREELNKDRTCTFTVVTQAGEDIAARLGTTLEFILSAGYRELEIQDFNGTTVYTGFVDAVQGSGGSGEMGIKTVTSRGFFSLLEKRYTAALKEFDATDAGAIAWALIDETQNKTYGDFGITEGSITTSKTRDRTYRWRNIKEAIQKLSSNEVKEGFEFEVDLQKAFNVYYPMKGSSNLVTVFDSKHNIDNWQVTKTGLLGMCNHAIVFGAGDGENMVVEEEDAETTYKEQYFLLEEGVSDKDNGDATLLADKGKKYLDLYKYPRKKVTFAHFYTEPLVTTYNVGDRVKVVIDEEGVDSTFRVMKRTISMDGRVQLNLEEYNE